MAGLEAKFGSTAERLLTKFGRKVALVRTVEGAFDPSTGGSADTTQAVNGVGVSVPIKAKEINGTSIQFGDQKLLFRGDAIEIGDRFNGYRVNSVEPLNPDDSGDILQTAILRR